MGTGVDAQLPPSRVTPRVPDVEGVYGTKVGFGGEEKGHDDLEGTGDGVGVGVGARQRVSKLGGVGEGVGDEVDGDAGAGAGTGTGGVKGVGTGMDAQLPPSRLRSQAPLGDNLSGDVLHALPSFPVRKTRGQRLRVNDE